MDGRETCFRANQSLLNFAFATLTTTYWFQCWLEDKAPRSNKADGFDDMEILLMFCYLTRNLPRNAFPQTSEFSQMFYESLS